jgi:nitroreductase
MEFKDVIEGRKSVRSFQKIPVEKEIINEILDCARLAPSWMNKQCWQFIVITDVECIKEIAKTGIINRWLRQVPVIIIACADPQLSGENNKIPYFVVDTAIAIEHIVLAATNMGLGTCWIGSYDENKIKTLLEIPPRIRIVALTALGYPNEKASIGEQGRKILIRSTQRKSLNEITHWERW